MDLDCGHFALRDDVMPFLTRLPGCFLCRDVRDSGWKCFPAREDLNFVRPLYDSTNKMNLKQKILLKEM